MNEAAERGPERGERSFPLPFKMAPTTLAAAAVLLLALAALLWPSGAPSTREGTLLVLDPVGGERSAGAFEPLAELVGEALGRRLTLSIATDLPQFRTLARQPATVVLCSDWVALSLPAATFVPLAVGRRHAPENLRPRAALVYRKDAGYLERPWLEAPDRTVLGDTLSLVAGGAIATVGGGDQSDQGARGRFARCGSGPDPFDHSPALHALRLGCFDYAIVREWAAERFFTRGLLGDQQWGIRRITGPVPDVVVLASREVDAPARVALRDALVRLGRGSDPVPALDPRARAGLATVGLDGFNVLLEPEFELIRRKYPARWPPTDG